MDASGVATATSAVDANSDNLPLPTDSMVTVRLSDVQIHPIIEESPRNSKARTSSVSSRSSSASIASDSGSTSPSNTSVNWEGLEKTEEQEARDQATDEVGWNHVPHLHGG